MVHRLVQLKILFSKWQLTARRLGRTRLRLLAALCAGLLIGTLWLTLGPRRLGLLVSGSRPVYENLMILWNDDPVKVHIIDVGQGDATLLQVYDQTILLDTGPEPAGPVLVDYLRDLGVRRLDLVILTHPHDDHVGGAKAVLEAMPVSSVLTAHDHGGSQLQQAFIARARELGIPCSSPYAGTQLTLGDVTLTCLHPRPAVYANLNNYSSVWRLDQGAMTWLFLADLEKDEFTCLANARPVFLRAGHHGSDTSFDETAFSRLSPDFVAISCGLNNSFGHPSAELITWLREARVPWVRTDHQGTRVFSSDGLRLTYQP